MIKRNRLAFTLTELTLAMALFSFVLLFAVNAFIQVNKIYIKGVTTKHVNDQASAILSDLSKNLQQEINPQMCEDASVGNCNSDSIATASGTTYDLCLPNQDVSYQWTIGEAGKFKKVFSNLCDGGSVSNAQNLIEGNVKVVAFNISKVEVSSNHAWSIEMVLSTQNSDQLTDDGDPINTRCTGQVSDQYCSVVYLTTLIRINQ